jgi:hypothetical protein
LWGFRSSRARTAVVLLLAGVTAGEGVAQPSGVSTEKVLAIAVSQLDEGDIEAGLFTLTSLVERLRADGASAGEMAPARAYLGLAYLQSNQMERAVAEVQGACRDDLRLVLSPERFPPLLLERCREARAATEAASAPPRRPAGTKPPEKGGRKLWPILVGVGAAAGVAIAVAGGGDDGEPAPTNGGTAPVERRVTAATTITQASDDGYICERPPCDPALTEYAIARALFEFNPLPPGQRQGATLAVDVSLEMSSPTRLRASPRDGCAPNAQLFIELEEPNGARYELAEQPFASRADPIYQADTRLQLSYPFGLAGPFVPGAWELTLTFKHYPNGSFTTCEGTIQLNAATLEVLVRN